MGLATAGFPGWIRWVGVPLRSLLFEGLCARLAHVELPVYRRHTQPLSFPGTTLVAAFLCLNHGSEALRLMFKEKPGTGSTVGRGAGFQGLGRKQRGARVPGG